VIDGDTIEIEANFLPKPLKPFISIRLATDGYGSGIDAPEIYSPKCSYELNLGMEVKQFVEEEIKKAKCIKVIFYGKDKYFRITGDFFVDGKRLTKMLLDANLARKYNVNERRKSWCENVS
jgi:endonuclease YncB( thermonuclease family)